MKTNVDDLGVCGVIVEDWDKTKEFKPKTITTDYSSWIVYISRRPVPANTPITDTYYWKPLTRLQTQIAFDYNIFKEEITKAFAKLTYTVETFLKSTEPGAALADEFGNNNYVGVSQKAITEALNKIWNKIEDMNGEPRTDIIMTVNPDYYVSETGCDVNITVRATSIPTEIEKIEFYVNDYDTPMLDDEGNPIVFEHVDSQKVFTYHIDNDTIILCKAWILGIEYRDNVEIKRLNEFFLGTCQSGADEAALIENIKEYVIIHQNSIELKDRSSLRVTRDVTCADSDHIVIVVEKSHYNDKIIRMDMNGIEIDSTPITVVKNNTEYIAYVSDSMFIAGTYNIDING